ncbi:MAG: sulfatase-like hydrolase/transferase, partial [Planctomycetes bacterium]|nr:sulfatase-like hydrolase/transferase [Planctomycetota bacterium]
MTPRTRHTLFLGILAIGTLAAALPTANARGEDRPPNIIFILTDDLGFGDPGCFGHPYIKTPNLDRLARQGTLFTQFYTNNPVCSPSRTAFMTGHYPARHRVHQHFATHQQNRQRRMPDWLDPGATTVPDCLKKAGYATAHFGKWHLCGGTIADAPSPSAYGIDDHRTCTSSGPNWKVSKYPYFRAQSTGLFVDETIRFIRANKDRPFYVNLWTLVPHATLKPTPEELAVYEGLQVDPARFKGRMRAYADRAKNLDAQARVYFAAVTGMDKALGRLLDTLDDMKLSENTLILFTSDNGPEDYHVGNAANAGMGSPGEFRGRKRSIYEGGVRTSCIVRWPGHVPAGRVDDTSVLTAVDFLPTVCRLAGIAPPDISPDGEDVSDILLGKSRSERKPIYWQWRGGVAGDPSYRPPGLAVRDGKWKLLINPDGTGAELYDIPADPAENRNLAEAQPEIVRRLSEQVLAWKKT